MTGRMTAGRGRNIKKKKDIGDGIYRQKKERSHVRILFHDKVFALYTAEEKAH